MGEQPNTAGTRPRRHLVVGLIVVASLIGLVATFALWAKRQALETDTWTQTSSKLLENEDIRDAVGAFLVDELYSKVDVKAEVEGALPPNAKKLAGPVSGALRNVADTAAQRALARPRVQQAWEQANRIAHEQFLNVVEEKEGTISNQNGEVTLDLSALVTQVGERAGLDVEGKVPPDAGQMTILKSDQLGTVQNGIDLLQKLAYLLTIVALGLFALSVFLAAGWRRQALRSVGVAFVVIGVATLAIRGIAGGAVTGALTSTAGNEPAVNAVWSIGTSLLKSMGAGLIGYGVVILFGAWLAGPGTRATSLRRSLTPYLRDRPVAYAAAAGIVLLVLWWAPTEGTRRLVPALLLIALFIAGIEALRSQALRDSPADAAGPAADGPRRLFRRE